MRSTSTTIAVFAAILISCFHLEAAWAQDDTMVITPESYADMVNGGGPKTLPPPRSSGAATPYTPGAYPQGGPTAEPTQPAQGYASEKLPGADEGTFSMDEIQGAGHRFFGKVSVGFAKVVEYAF